MDTTEREKILWAYYKRFKRKYKKEIPVEFKPYVLAAMREYAEKMNAHKDEEEEKQ